MDVLATYLDHTFSSDRDQRASAEQYLEQGTWLQNDVDGSFGTMLAQILCVPTATISVSTRQAAAIALKKYVRRRWSLYFDTFLSSHADENGVQRAADAAPLEAKQRIRAMLLVALYDAERKVRCQASDLLSIICSCDFPDQFPELLPTLHAYLRSYALDDPLAPDKVHGAMKFLTDLVHVELDENQLLMVAQELVPVLQDLLTGVGGRITPHTKARCINVFHQCLTSMYMAKDTYTEAVEKITAHYLPTWLQGMQELLEAFIYNPSAEAASERLMWEEVGLKHQIVSFLGTASHFTSIFQAYAPALVHLVVSNLRAYVPLFIASELKRSVLPPLALDGDSDVVCTVPALAESCLLFLMRQLRSKTMRQICVRDGIGGDGIATDMLNEILLLMRTYAQATREDIETWDSDVDVYVEQDDADNVQVGLRPTTADLMESMLDTFPLPVLRLCRAWVDEPSLNENESVRVDEMDLETAWVPLEAKLWLLGSTHEAVSEVLLDREEPDLLSIPNMLERLVLPNVSMHAPAYLCGRCFIVSSQYVEALPEDVARKIFLAAMETIHAPDELVSLQVKLSAVRAICNIQREKPEVTRHDGGTVLKQFGGLLPNATHSTLVLILETIEAFIPQRTTTSDVDLATLIHTVHAVLKVWYSHTMDPSVELSVSYVLQTLVQCTIAGCREHTVRVCMEALAPCLAAEQEEVSLAPSAAAMIRSVLQVADAASLLPVIPTLFPRVAAYMLVADDVEAMQNLIQSLAMILDKCPDTVLAWSDERGVAAIQVMLQIIERVLCMDEQMCGHALGKFLVTIFVQAGERLAPVMAALLHALVAKLAHATTSECAWTLLYALAFLMAHHADAVVKQLDSTDMDRGESALVLFVRRWLADVGYVTTPDVMRVHIQGLVQLFIHWTPSLEALYVDGDVLPAPDDRIMTRSRAKSGKYA